MNPPTPTDIPTPIHDKLLFDEANNFDVPWSEEFQKLERENVTLREELKVGEESYIAGLTSGYELRLSLLTQQRDELKAELAAEIDKSCQTIIPLEKTICELRSCEPLLCDIAQIFDGWHSDGTCWSEHDESVRKRLSEFQQALSSTPSEISEKWVKREVLNQCRCALYGYISTHNVATDSVIYKAYDAARTELGKEEK